MDGGNSRAVAMKPIPLPRKANKNFEAGESPKSLTPKHSSESSSDINSNIDNLLEQKPILSKFPTRSGATSPNSKPVPLPRKRTGNGTTGNSFNPHFPPVAQSLVGSVLPEEFEEEDDIDYENIPSHPNMTPKDLDGKRTTINLFKRDVGDPFEDFENSFREPDQLSAISFRSPLEDLDEAERSRISISSLSSSATTGSKSSSDYSEHYMEPPPPRPVPPELAMHGRWRHSAGNPPVHASYSSNTVPSKPKRSPNIVLPRLSSLEEGTVMSPLKQSHEKMTSCPTNTNRASKGDYDGDPDLSYEPISSYTSSGGVTKFHTISSSSTKGMKSSSGKLGISNSAESTLPINRNFSHSKRVTVPNLERVVHNGQSSLTNHTSFKGTEEISGRGFDPTAYDISDLHAYDQASHAAGDGLSRSFLDGGGEVIGKRRSLATPLSGSQEFQCDRDSGDRSASSVILRRHSSSRSGCSSVGSNGTTGSRRESYKKKHEYDEVAIEDGAVVFLSHPNSDSSAMLNNNSSFTSRHSVLQEFDPLLYARTSNIGMGFPMTTTPLDLNDTQQHRYEYIDTDSEDAHDTTSCEGYSITNEESPLPGVLPLCLDNPGYSPSTPRSSREIRVLDDAYEPVESPKEGISPRLSPKPKMGTRALLKSDEFGKQGMSLPPTPPALLPGVEDQVDDKSSDIFVNPGSLGIGAPASSQAATGSGNFFRKISSKLRLNAIKEERDDRRSESLLSSEETYSSVTTPCTKCFEPHPESTKCKFIPIYRQQIVFSSHLSKTTGLSKKEFSKKWAVLAKGKLTFYNDKKDVISEIPLDKFVVVTKKDDHNVSQSQGDLKCFEVGFSGGKSSKYVFASPSDGERCNWMQKFIEVFTSAFPTPVLSNFDKGGWCFLKETVTTEWRPCWLILKGRTLYYSFWKSEESFEMDLRKARTVFINQKDKGELCRYVDNTEMLTVDFISRLLYIQTDSSKILSSWEKLIKAASYQNGAEFHEMQLTLDNVPVVVDKCIDFLYAHGTLAEGIYRQSGSNSRITQLLQDFKFDAWSVQISHKEYSAHDVAGTLKRFFRQLPEPLVTVRLYNDWIQASGIRKDKEKMERYMQILDELPAINYNIMKKLMCHLYAIHELHDKNLMPLINLAPIWGPTLLNVDTSKLETSYEIACAECEVVKDLIENYYTLFRVDPQEIEREKKMQFALADFHSGSTKRKQSGDMKISIYLWERDETSINITVSPKSTTQAIVQQICSLKKIKNVDNLTLYDVICNENLERPLHPSEKVIETVLRWSVWDNEERTSSYLILKKNTLYPSLVHYAKEPKSISGELKYADSKSKSFRKYTFQFSQAALKYFKDSKSTTELTSWKIEDIVWYMGCESKRNAPTKWTFTFVKRTGAMKRSKEEPYFGNVVVCASEDELHKWIGAMVIGEHPEGLSPIIV